MIAIDLGHRFGRIGRVGPDGRPAVTTTELDPADGALDPFRALRRLLDTAAEQEPGAGLRPGPGPGPEADRRAVLGISASAGGEDELRRAAESAGLDVERVLPDPVAVALHYGAVAEGVDHAVLVCDQGATTLDLTVLAVSPDLTVRLVDTRSLRLGGDDWDAALAVELAGRLPDGVDPRRAAQTLRRALGTADRVTEHLTDPAGERHPVTLERAAFERAVAPLRERALAAVAGQLADAETAVDTVLLAGGLCATPGRRAEIEALPAARDLTVRCATPELAVVSGLLALRDFGVLRIVTGPASASARADFGHFRAEPAPAAEPADPDPRTWRPPPQDPEPAVRQGEAYPAGADTGSRGAGPAGAGTGARGGDPGGTAAGAYDENPAGADARAYGGDFAGADAGARGASRTGPDAGPHTGPGTGQHPGHPAGPDTGPHPGHPAGPGTGQHPGHPAGPGAEPHPGPDTGPHHPHHHDGTVPPQPDPARQQSYSTPRAASATNHGPASHTTPGAATHDDGPTPRPTVPHPRQAPGQAPRQAPGQGPGPGPAPDDGVSPSVEPPALFAVPVGELQAVRRDDHLLVLWAWPDSALSARVRWRREDASAGGGPRDGDVVCRRRVYEHDGGFDLAVGRGAVTLTVEALVPDLGADCEGASSLLVRAEPPVVEYEPTVRRRLRGRVATVTFTSETGCELPRLRVVHSLGRFRPTSTAEGTVLHEVAAQRLPAGTPLTVEFPLPATRGPSWLVCFPADANAGTDSGIEIRPTALHRLRVT
ncbi:Hsp70 family protein [Streptomyces sp. NPDC001595]|uniref:Hsp70 family protein n=1 Tax=Streptomyces sp. NPDC001532 TaxID=3154520 RepID=UPI00332B0F74